MVPQRSLRRLLAAAAFVSAVVGGGVPGSAQAAAPAAAACSSDSGVTVVVNFNDLGGGVVVVCDRDGGGKAASDLFPRAGYPLSYAARQPGFVCRVKGVPTSDPCVNTSPSNAYWGLWWSDGKTGTWSYSGLGADALTIPDGGYVALAWDQSDGDARPGFDPASQAAPPDVTPDAAEPESDGLPSFVAPALIGTLFGVAAVVYLVRRRPGSP